MAEEKRTVLVVDDDVTFRTRLAKAFEARGFDVRSAQNCNEAIASARTDSPELAVVDLRMPDGSGLEVVRELKQIDPTTNIVVLTGYGSIATALEAVHRGATHYLTKPADVDDLLAAFARAGQSEADVIPTAHEVPSLARIEWEHIHRVLGDCGGNITQAAKLLRMHRRSLQRKLSKYPVPK
ncbi:MAG: response regulator transcription factor [Polyangiaceae bacterium]